MKRKVFIVLVCAVNVVTNAQTSMYYLAKSYADVGHYHDAIRIMKNVAKNEFGTEYFVDDIACLARYYSKTNEIDSVIHYNLMLRQLANDYIGINDSIAEELIQSTAWNLYDCGQYDMATKSATKVLELRDKIYGVNSEKSFEWLDVMSFQAYCATQLTDMMKFCQAQFDRAEQLKGVNSTYYREAISSIRAYANQLVDAYPQFTTVWIDPYYNKIQQLNILPKFQYEFEILQLAGFLAMDNLQLADLYAHKLERWTYSYHASDIPLEDKVRIKLKLANHYLHMGDYFRTRYTIDTAWKALSDNHVQPSMAQLIDRHIVEMQLRMDSCGFTRMNTEWIIETASPIINAGIEDSETLAFFYESRATAYDELGDYDKAIYDIKKSIDLKPLSSRKNKLAQLYLEKSQFELAEQQFLELYNDSYISDVGRKSIESDMIMLYWLWGKLDKLSTFIKTDYENMKDEIKHAFVFMGEDERENYLDRSLVGGLIKYDIYTGYSDNAHQWAEGNCYAYNLALVQKGLLLNTTIEIKEILKEVPDSLKETLMLYELVTKHSHPYTAEADGREYRLKLMNYVSNQPEFLNQLNYTWRDVRNELKSGEAAIEFINLLGISPDNMKTAYPGIGALILKKGFQYPIFVKLSSNNLIDSMFVDDSGECVIDIIYSNAYKQKIYQAIWEPLEEHLEDIKTIYYAPTGVMHNISLDWIGRDNTDVLCSRYKLYRVSSTRELCNQNYDNPNNNAVLYGNIKYSFRDGQITDVPISKYRSTTRAGFMPLEGTAVELDSIKRQLSDYNIQSFDFTQNKATEGSFHTLSGNSPKILHIATHGFYYTRSAIDEEFPKGTFIAYQAHNPELYHSGLALSGAQDTWINDTEGGGLDFEKFEKFFEMDSDNDGIILSAEIAKIDLSKTDIVVLSACETALGRVTSDGVYGLQRAFKLAGVNSIIMSLWKVDDQATQLLMSSFYNKYLGGMSKREALLFAQTTVQKTPGFEDPYYWAAFILLDGI